jgi:hypothetical protein
MAGLLNTASTLSCPHGGKVTGVPSSGRVSADGAPLLLATDTFMVAGCPFVPVTPHPCVLVQWQLPAQRSTSGKIQTLTEASVGFCMAADGAIQGPVIVQATQQRGASL